VVVKKWMEDVQGIFLLKLLWANQLVLKKIYYFRLFLELASIKISNATYRVCWTPFSGYP